MNTPAPTVQTVALEPNDVQCLAMLCGQHDEHLRQIEKRLQIGLVNRGNQFQLTGPAEKVGVCATLLADLYQQVLDGVAFTPDQIHLQLQAANVAQLIANNNNSDGDINNALGLVKIRKTTIKPRGGNQKDYVRAIQTNDINFGIGPAGTGKTYLAVACAVAALETEQVRRILLVRPAVEAGEKLGFLPGDLAQKIDPYLRPLYDALYEMMGFEKVTKMIEHNTIEVAPLAYMRGRTLNHSFIILDESQNTTREQMKMFLTRIGFGSTAVITGDITQVDLPRGTKSGLNHAIDILKDVNGIHFTHFDSTDVVRHPLVQRIVEAYERHESNSDTDTHR